MFSSSDPGQSAWRESTLHRGSCHCCLGSKGRCLRRDKAIDSDRGCARNICPAAGPSRCMQTVGYQVQTSIRDFGMSLANPRLAVPTRQRQYLCLRIRKCLLCVQDTGSSATQLPRVSRRIQRLGGKKEPPSLCPCPRRCSGTPMTFHQNRDDASRIYLARRRSTFE